MSQFTRISAGTLHGREGNDWLSGGKGNDFLDGGKGNDMAWGGKGNDILLGSQGDNILSGDQGDDTLCGGEGNNLLIGGKGNDVLDGCEGNATLIGGQGSDILALSIHPGVKVIADFTAGEDSIGLLGGLQVEQLEFESDNGNTLIRVKRTGQAIASLTGVKASTLIAEDFGTL